MKLTYRVSSGVDALETLIVEGNAEHILIGTVNSATSSTVVFTEWLSIDGTTKLALSPEMTIMMWLSLTQGMVADERISLEVRTMASAVVNGIRDMYGKEKVH